MCTVFVCSLCVCLLFHFRKKMNKNKQQRWKYFYAYSYSWSISWCLVLFGKQIAHIYLKIILIHWLYWTGYYFWYCELGNKFEQASSPIIIRVAYRSKLSARLIRIICPFQLFAPKIRSEAMIKQIVQSIYVSTRRLHTPLFPLLSAFHFVPYSKKESISH